MKARLTVSASGRDDLSALCALNDMRCAVGILPENDARPGTIGNAALLALHEQGSPLQGIPARPVMQNALKSLPFLEDMRKGLVSVLDGGDAARALSSAGESAAEAVRAGFETIGPKNSPATAESKGADSPLVETGALRAAVSSGIRTNGKKR